MKLNSIPLISTELLGNSLFECITIDATDGKPLSRSEPTMINIGVVCLCLRGSGIFSINEQEYTIGKGSLITLLPNSVIKGSHSSDDFLGYAIAVDTKAIMSVRAGDTVKSFVRISANPVLKISEQQTSSVIELCEILRRKRSEANNPFGKEIVHHLLAVLCYEIHALYQSQIPELKAPAHPSRQSTLCQQFLELVEHHAAHHRDMGFYADKLCITPKYLSVVVRKSSGRSPIEWIDRTVMLYARTLLASSDMTVQQIATELNFPNPSFFGQYFKRHLGTTPKKYRTQTKH